MSDEQWIVRDARRPGHYWADNEIYDVYAPIVGVYAFSVYMALCRYASSEGASHPSTSTIADQLGISRPTVVKAVQTLERHGLIHVDARRLPVRGQTTNEYTLLRVDKTAVKEVDSGPDRCQPPLQALSTTFTPPVKEVDSHINNTHVNKTQLTTPPPPLTPPAPPLRLIPGGRGGGGGGEEEVKEIDDEGETDEGTAVLVDECELESEERRKAELVDQLVALRVWRSSAVEAVAAGTVATNHDIVCCKRFCESSRLDNPAGSLWSNWLSTGQVPPIPQLSDTDPGVIDAARRLSADLDRQREKGGLMIDQRALDALKARLARPVLKSMPPAVDAATYWRTT